MLRAAVASARSIGVPLRFAPPPLTAPEIARGLMARYGESAGPRKSANALQALLRRLRLAQYDWARVAPADRLEVGWVLWEGAAPPAENEKFLSDFLEWIELPRRRLQAARLATSWAAAFDPMLKSIRSVGDWLARNATWLPEPWPGLAETFDIFSLENGPACLAEAFLAGEEGALGFFQRLRLPAQAATGGLALEALAAAAARVGKRLEREPRLSVRLCDLALHGALFLPDAAGPPAKRRGGLIRRALAETLLLSWKPQAAPAEVKRRVLGFLLRHYGDARVTREYWKAIPAPTVAILCRWLTEETVASYFRLAFEAKSADRQRLAERKAFWDARLDQIEAAWLVTGFRNVASFGSDQPGQGALSGCRPDQSALLLRVDGMILLESSHEANERVWLPGNPLAPPLYRGADQPYWPGVLTAGADFSSAYSREGNDTWQERLAGFIERQCGTKAKGDSERGLSKPDRAAPRASR